MIELSLEKIEQEIRLIASGNFTKHLKLENFEVIAINLSEDLASRTLQFEKEITLYEKLEFAFIAHNNISKEIIFATDFYASKPLFYAFENNKLLIDTNLKSIVDKLSNVTLNFSYLRDYFKPETNQLLGYEYTIYNEILRVLPANIVKFLDGRFQKKCYWKPILDEKIYSYSNDKLAQVFLEKFTESVAAKCKSSSIKGAQLSGGLDSSSVVSLLSSLGEKINTYYWDTKTEDTNEGNYANFVVKKWKTTHKELSLDFRLTYNYLLEIIKITAQPETSLFPPSMPYLLADCAEKEKVNMIFTGQGGDNVVSTGYEYIDEIIMEENWDLLALNLKLLSNVRQKKNYPQNYAKNSFENTVLQFLIPVIVEAFKSKNALKALRFIYILLFKFKVSTTTLIRLALKKIKTSNKAKIFIPEIIKNKIPQISKINKDLIPQLNTTKKYIKNHFEGNLSLGSTRGNEILSALFFNKNILVSDPFFDKNLLEFSLMVSPKYRFDKGRLRGTLRNAMYKIIPDEIYNRTSKAEATEVAYLSAKNLLINFEKNINLYSKTWEILNFESYLYLKNIVLDHSIKIENKRMQIWTIIRIISFAIWLNIQEKTIKITP